MGNPVNAHVLFPNTEKQSADRVDDFSALSPEAAQPHFGFKGRAIVIGLLFLAALGLQQADKSRNMSRSSVASLVENINQYKQIEKDSTRNWVIDPEFYDYISDYSEKGNFYSPQAVMLTFYLESRYRTSADNGSYFTMHQLNKKQFQQYVLNDPKGVSKIIYGDEDHIDRSRLGWVDGKPPKIKLTVRKARNKKERQVSAAQLKYLREITNDLKQADGYKQSDIFRDYYVPRKKEIHGVDGFYSMGESYALYLWPKFLEKAREFREDALNNHTYADREALMNAYENLTVINGNRPYPKKPSKGASQKEWSRYHRQYRLVSAERGAYKANGHNLDANKPRTGNNKVITLRDFHQSLIKPVLTKLPSEEARYSRALKARGIEWGNGKLRYDAAKAFEYADAEYFQQTGQRIPVSMAYCDFEDKDGWKRPPFLAVLKHAHGDCIKVPEESENWRIRKILAKYGFQKKLILVKNYETKEMESWPHYQYGGYEAVSWWVDGSKKRYLKQYDFQLIDWQAFGY